VTRLADSFLAIGLLGLAIAILYALSRLVQGDVAAILGIATIWLLVFLYTVGPACALPRSEADIPEMRTYLRSRAEARRWPLIAIWLLAPGLWTGAVAEHPILVSLLSLGTFEVCYTINRLIPSRLPMMSETRRLRLDRMAFRLLVYLGGTLAGMELRSLL
jgi:hypothetical protein